MLIFKFRAYDKVNKHMLEWEHIAIAPNNGRFSPLCISGDGITIRTDNNRFIIQQHTGYLNWYQGDIIRSDHFIDPEKGQQYLYHKIVWSDKYLCWCTQSLGYKGVLGELDFGNSQLWVFIQEAINPVIVGYIHDKKE